MTVSEVLLFLCGKPPYSPEVIRLAGEAFRSESGSVLVPSTLFLDPTRLVSLDYQKRLQRWIEQLNLGQPLQYITGYQNFYGLDFQVGPGVLIPRPETEILVETAVTRLNSSDFTGRPLFGFELGLGSGAISLSLIKNLSRVSIHATEISKSALNYFNKNKESLLNGDLKRRIELLNISEKSPMAPFLEEASRSGKRDFFISNPPYLAHLSMAEATSSVIAHEPHIALFAPEANPLYFYNEIAKSARYFLKQGAWIGLEIPHERSLEIEGLFKDDYTQVKILNDLTERPRILEAYVL